MYTILDSKNFFKYVDKNGPVDKRFPELGPCWVWTSHKSNKGYGKFTLNKRYWTAHRLSYFIHSGINPEGKIVCHKCDRKLCVNPDHLFLGTHDDNMKDCILKNRRAILKPPIRFGADNNATKLSDEEVVDIFMSPLNQNELAKRYNVKQTTISRIKRRTIWVRLTNDLVPPKDYLLGKKRNRKKNKSKDAV